MEVDVEAWCVDVQPFTDAMAPVGVGRDAPVAGGRRSSYVAAPGCGHASLAEQPELVALHRIDVLRAHPMVPA